jgi:hypothetical protein
MKESTLQSSIAFLDLVSGVHSKPSPTVSYRNDQLFLALSLDFLGFNTRSCVYSMKTPPTELRQTMTCLIKDNIKRNENGMYTPSMIPVIGLMYISVPVFWVGRNKFRLVPMWSNTSNGSFEKIIPHFC